MRRRLTTRLDPHGYAFVTHAATRAGVSVSDYVATAALFRASLDYARDFPDSLQQFEAGYEAAGVALAEAAGTLLDGQDPLKK